jgi:hypothetical protein
MIDKKVYIENIDIIGKESMPIKKNDGNKKGHRKTVSFKELSELAEYVEITDPKLKKESQETDVVSTITPPEETATFYKELCNEKLIKKVKKTQYDKEFEKLLDNGATPGVTDKKGKGLLDIIVDKAARREQFISQELETKSTEESKTDKIEKARAELGNLVNMTSSLLTRNSQYPLSPDADPTQKGKNEEHSPLKKAQNKLLRNSPIKNLLQRNADNQLITTMHNSIISAEKLNYRKIGKLLQGGANPNVTNLNGESALNLALVNLQKSTGDSRGETASTKAIGALIANGADIFRQPSAEIMSPLEHAQSVFGKESYIAKFMQSKQMQKEEGIESQSYESRLAADMKRLNGEIKPNRDRDDDCDIGCSLL